MEHSVANGLFPFPQGDDLERVYDDSCVAISYVYVDNISSHPDGLPP